MQAQTWTIGAIIFKRIRAPKFAFRVHHELLFPSVGFVMFLMPRGGSEICAFSFSEIMPQVVDSFSLPGVDFNTMS